MPHDVLARVARRRRVVDAILSASAGILTTSIVVGILTLVWMPGPAALAIAIVAGVVTGAGIWRATAHSRGCAAAARGVERVHPASNVVITFEELQRHPERAPAWMHQLVTARASEQLTAVDVRSVVPARRAFALAGLALFAAVGATLLVSRPAGVQAVIDEVQRTARELVPGRAATVRVVIQPPSYTGRPSVTLDDPARIDALAGSVISFATDATVRVRFGDEVLRGPFVARQTGYFAVESSGQPARLVPITVVPDEAPSVRVDDPGKDLMLPPGDRAVALRFSAVDDLALDGVELRYTRVAGRGEQFEFQEGTLPIDVERLGAREWRGRGQLSISRLGLEPGDSLVYRVVARDRRASEAGTGSSDTYFLEIAGPGQVALEGIEMPPDMERYALSQQMIVLKLERLRARERTLDHGALAEETAGIAAEQRAVRANFIFLMGGHVEDEEVEAEQSHEIQEGRLENRARRDINAAIGYMTRVEQGLAAVNTSAALPPARQAVDALQRAFGRSRYLLRSLSVSSRLDPSRRLTGKSSDSRSWRREPGQEGDKDTRARDLFDGLATAAASMGPDRSTATVPWESLAESALRIDPASAFWRETSQSIAALARASDADRPSAVRRILEAVSVHARRESLPRSALATQDSALLRAWRTETKR